MPQPLKPVNYHVDDVTIADIENHKLISTAELRHDLLNVKKYDARHNTNNFAGNRFLYHFQLKNLLRCRREDGQTIYDVAANPVAWASLLEQTKKRNRGGRTAAGNVFECFRINSGSIVMFKATTAKYLYQKYQAQHVLDPTAGWGGRMIGAWALGINYTGIDTNIDMVPAYEHMRAFLDAETPRAELFSSTAPTSLRMIWKSCLDVDFSTIPYDCVVTSPPYINLELYEHMPQWKSDELFYTTFLVPLWKKCRAHIKSGGHICFNISPMMYEQAQKFGLPACDEEEFLKQQMGQRMSSLKRGTKKHDKIYVWKCS